MKKLFTLFAAVLVAGSMLAQFDTWSVVGSKAILNGSADWAITEAANDMATEDGVNYTLTVTGKTLEAGTKYEYKIAKGHAWSNGEFPGQNASLTVAETAVYDIVYTANVADKTQSAVATKAGEAGEISHVYSIAGSSADLFGAAWDQTATATEMTKGEDGIYSWTKEGVELAAATIEFKVVVDHAWGEAYPSSNAKLVIAEAATYNVVITFNPADKAVNATATKVGGEPGPGPDPDPEATVDTLYLVNSKGWGAPKIYFYGGTVGQLTAWPGDDMIKVNGVKADGFDVYMFSINRGEQANVIFNNGGSVQSGDLVIAGNEGKYFNFADQTWYESAEAVVCTWYINANYNGAIEWRELTRGEGTFSRRDVYAPAANYYYNGMAADNLKSEIKGAKLTVAAELAAGDSALFVLDPYAKTINVTKIETEGPGPEPEVNYYLAGSMNTPAWSSVAMEGDSIVLHLEAGDYGFKVQLAEGVWNGAMGFSAVDAECSSEGLTTNADGNVCFTLAEAGDVTIKVVDGHICATGAFETEGPGPEPEVKAITLKGINNDWVGTDMIFNEDKTEASLTVSLEAKEYEFKLYDANLTGAEWLGNNGTMTRENCTGWLMEAEAGNCHIEADQDGEYIFVYIVATHHLSVTYPTIVTGMQNTTADAAQKVLRNGQVLIIRDGKTYNAAGVELR